MAEYRKVGALPAKPGDGKEPFFHSSSLQSSGQMQP